MIRFLLPLALVPPLLPIDNKMQRKGKLFHVENAVGGAENICDDFELECKWFQLRAPLNKKYKLLHSLFIVCLVVYSLSSCL